MTILEYFGAKRRPLCLLPFTYFLVLKFGEYSSEIQQFQLGNIQSRGGFRHHHHLLSVDQLMKSENYLKDF